MEWLVVYQIAYIIILVLVCLRIIYDTRSHTKTLAYLLFAIFVPFIGIGFYLMFGINHRKRKLFSKKLVQNDVLAKQLGEDIFKYSKKTFDKSDPDVKEFKELALMLLKDNLSPLTGNNAVELLVNGEGKFPRVLEAISQAKDHIHVEYYTYDDDNTGMEIAEALIVKAREGVTVRFMYDAFGSLSIRRKMINKLKEAGISVYPFYRILFIAFANRMNYRNHRKIIVIDGSIAFVGGINVADRYVNAKENAKEKAKEKSKINSKENSKLFWRDTHLKIEGPGVHYLQYIFLCDWNFCSKELIPPTEKLFPKPSSLPVKGDKVVQIAASGPDSDVPTILFSLLQGINLAEEEVLITTPYFIPTDSIMDSMMAAALGGVKIILLVPFKSDSALVNAAAKSHYEALLKAGVEIYFYKKGFLHSKTMVVDRKVTIVGTANLDYRSFDLNFEVNAIVYDTGISEELAEIFFEDLKHSEKINAEEWYKRPMHIQLLEKTAGLLSPIL